MIDLTLDSDTEDETVRRVPITASRPMVEGPKNRRGKILFHTDIYLEGAESDEHTKSYSLDLRESFPSLATRSSSACYDGGENRTRDITLNLFRMLFNLDTIRRHLQSKHTSKTWRKLIVPWGNNGQAQGLAVPTGSFLSQITKQHQCLRPLEMLPVTSRQISWTSKMRRTTKPICSRDFSRFGLVSVNSQLLQIAVVRDLNALPPARHSRPLSHHPGYGPALIRQITLF